VSRNFKDWLAAYTQYASFSEAPRRMHFWSGVSAVAGALRRKVWINMGYFRWHANMYIIFVAPPGVVAKSTTVAIAMDLLRKVPGINFGPDVVTWQALVKAFGEYSDFFEYNGEQYPQSAMTLESGEFGNLVDPSNREQIDLLVALWDGKQGAFKKVTKGSGSDTVENPWINIIACTTPAWIAGNFPEYIIGGGFTSRCIFVYAEEKEKFVAYPGRHLPKDFIEQQLALVQDLDHIANTVVGEYKLTEEAFLWGEEWYRTHWKTKPDELDDDRFSGYLSRKQTHIHKLAMIMAAAVRDELIITVDDLKDSALMVKDLERDMQKVFSRIGRTNQSVQAERFIRFVYKRGIISYSMAYQYIHSAFPNVRDFEGIVAGAIRAGFIERVDNKGEIFLKAKLPSVRTDNLNDNPSTPHPGD
jgi:Protein of unknown function (DUF3987)